MLDALTKFVDLLKASGWQLAMIAAAGGAFLLFAGWDVIPGVEPWMLATAWAVMLVAGALALAPLAGIIQGTNARRRARRRAERAFRDYVPHLTERERRILGYLRHHNQRTFEADVDGGYANTLFGRGFVIRALTRGQVFEFDRMPLAVPDHVWKVMQEMPERFPYEEPEKDEHEAYPWRIPWMAR